MKKLILGAALAAAAFGAHAQRVVNNPSNHPFWGIRASLDVSCPTNVTYKDEGFKETESLFKNGVGFSVGAIYHLPIVANFYFEPGLSFFYNTWANKDLGELDEEDIDVVKNNSYRQTGLRIPLNFGYHFDFTDDFKVSIFTGPQLQVGLSCDQYFTAKAGNLEYHVAPSMYSGDDGFNRFNASWNVGVGFTYQHVYLGVTSSLEMTNMIRSDEDFTGRMNTVSIALGYNF